MTLNKQFAQDCVSLGDCMDQLVEVLAQLLGEESNTPAPVDCPPVVTAIADLRSTNTRAIHVV